MQCVAGGEAGVDIAEDGGEAQQVQLRRPQRHEDGHRVICMHALRCVFIRSFFVVFETNQSHAIDIKIGINTVFNNSIDSLIDCNARLLMMYIPKK